MPIQKNIAIALGLIVAAVFLLVTNHHYDILPSTRALGDSIRRPSSHTKTVKPRYVFVDLGANAADSLAVFLQEENAKFKWDFPCPEWATRDEAEIFLFEANPYFNTALVQAKERYEARGIKVTIFPSTVVDVRDGTRVFFLDTVNNAKDFWGSSIYASAPDAILSKSNGTELSALNISRWLLMNFLPRDFVVVKMDIEGAEYEVIPHMAEMSVSSVVDHMYVEWHPSVLTEPEASQARASVAMEKLKADGVQMPYYDSAA